MKIRLDLVHILASFQTLFLIFAPNFLKTVRTTNVPRQQRLTI